MRGEGESINLMTSGNDEHFNGTMLQTTAEHGVSKLLSDLCPLLSLSLPSLPLFMSIRIFCILPVF
jgi:hypothetical protein